MKKEDRKHRIALTLLVSGVIFLFMFIAVAVSALTGSLLIETGAVELITPKKITPNRMIILLSLNSLIIGAAVTMATSRLPLKPINKIVDQLNRLAKGDFKARLHFDGPFSRHPTTIEITESFNKMAEELESTEMLRSDFINNFSHEFKTPIVSIAGFAKLLKRGNLTEEQKAEYLDIIEEESLRLSAMATNVLHMTKFENQTILTDLSEFNLSEQLRSSILALEGKWVKKEIDFNLIFEEYTITADKEMLKHVWLNLIDNAVKFSPDRGTVEIAIRETDTTYAVSVSNHGPKIPPEQQAKIFNKFYQADESHASEGNGIGLALVKSVVKLHSGEIAVHSEEGLTTFTITLPKTQACVASRSKIGE